MDLSVPAGRGQKMTKEVFEARKPQVEESREVRVALARVVGKATRNGLEGFSDLLEFWAVDPALPVREAVALSSEQAVTEQVGARQTLALLKRWCNDQSTGNALYKTWAAAAALCSIVAARPGRETYEQALDLLERLAHRTQASVKFYVSISLKRVARKVPLSDSEAPVALESVLKLVAQDENLSTKINVAEALCQARIADEAPALSVIQQWVSGPDIDCRWVGICSLLLWRRQKDEEWNREVVRFLGHDAQTTASVLVEILNQKDQLILERFSRFLEKTRESTLTTFASAFASVPQARLDEKLLSLLRGSEKRALQDLAVEIRAESWNQMLSTPSEFIADVQKALNKEHMAGEIYSAFNKLLTPEPGGSRDRLVQALVDSFLEQRSILEDVLTKLTMIAPPVFEPFSIEIRCRALRTLFHDPAALLDAINADPKVRDETTSALEFLVQPEPSGHREEMLDALLLAQTVDTPAVRMLLRQFRSMGLNSLNQFAYEFNLRWLGSELVKPDHFISHVWQAMYDAYERDDVLHVLRLLTMPEPQGQRKALVRALGISRLTRPTEVNMLLQNSSWQTRAGLLSFGTEVKLFSFLSYLFSPNIASQMFGVDG